MKRFRMIISICLAVVMALSCSSLCAAKEMQTVSLERFLAQGQTLPDLRAKPYQKCAQVSAAGEDSTLRLMVCADAAVDAYGAIAVAGPFEGISILQYETYAQMKKAEAALRKSAGVQWVCEDAQVQAAGNPIAEAIPGIAADGSKHFTWGAEYMGVDEYYDAVGTDGEMVTVAVLDTGIDTDHEMFGGFYDAAENPDGRILQGTSFVETETVEDDNGHGTHVSGTIADLTPSYVKILPVKVLDCDGDGMTSEILMGMLWAVAQGADIISMSLGGGVELYDATEYVVNYAYDQGTLCIVAAGNESMNADYANPARCEKSVTVGAVDTDLTRAFFSNYGEAVDICAPGTQIISANMGGGYIAYSGTSMATPHVSAVAAVYKAQDKSMTPAALEKKLKDTAMPMGKALYYGAGLVSMRNDDMPACRLNADVKEAENSISVTLSCAQDAQIYYTVNGTEPTTASSRYTAPLTITRTCLLRAVGYTANGKTVPVRLPIEIKDTKPVYTLLTDGDTLTGALGELPQTLTLPENITKIGDFALDGTDVVTLKTESKIQSVGDFAFAHADLREMDMTALRTVGNTAFMNTELRVVSLPNATYIGKHAFDGCAYLRSVGMDAARTIDDYAFCGTELEEVSMSGAETIGNGAFLKAGLVGCTFTELSLPNVKTIGDYAFTEIPLESVSCPKLTTLGGYAFAGCIELQTVSFPALTTTGVASLNNTGVQSLSLPKLEIMGEGTLFYSGYLTDLSVPMLKDVGVYAMYGIACEEINLPQAEIIRDGGCEDTAAKVIRAPKAKIIGAYALSSYSTQQLEIPSAETLGEAFAYGMRKFTVPDSVKTIDIGAFNGIGMVLVKENSVAHRFCEEYELEYALVGTKFTVRFERENGRLIREMTVDAGDRAKAPTPPRKLFNFAIGWEEVNGACYTECITCDATFRPVYITWKEVWQEGPVIFFEILILYTLYGSTMFI